MPDEIDTTNRFMVSMRGDEIILMFGPVKVLSKSDALNLAAYLVALAEDEPGKFNTLLDAIKNT